ncbi:flagellin [Rhizobium sp. SSA_523]|uniref:flagellin N-terminal helical domain-containing protein n=1 Tax=Rhizobium sp. SSA_523 TaxID=2952477 RepID=UPI002091968C|nr:flagellin [Rhizobium sp. SSA_523]MCO5730576.1 flagellin [Rhizobium sp. SSA_523]WKC25613.1 flagellin [Rhizobium sp. SSA_523]
MTSIMTNTAAIAALQTLRSVSSQLSENQNQISSGLRIETAADNAAYWSISTTMTSDAKAITAVADSLGFGAAIADTAYSGTQAIVRVLDDFKAKLVAASEPGVDTSKIQKELVQLNAQAESIVASSSFSSINWLSTEASTHLMETQNLQSSLVSSFSRLANGTVSVETTDVNLKLTSMLNRGGGGILQKELWGVGDIGGFRSTGINSVAHQGHESRIFTGPASFATGDYILFDINVDSGDHSAGLDFMGLTIDKAVVDSALGITTGEINSADDMRKVLQAVFTANGVPATAYEGLFSGGLGSNLFEIGSRETSGEPGSSITISNVTSDFNGAKPAGFALGLEGPPKDNHDNMYPKASIDFTKPFTVSPKSEIFFDVQVGSNARQTYTIDRTTVDAALGTTDGAIVDAASLAAVIAYASAGSALTVTASGPRLTFAADQATFPEAGNRAARVFVGNVQSIPPWALEFDLAEIDITGDRFTLAEYLTGVEYMLQRSIDGASMIGAVSARIQMQTEFTQSLLDTMERGVGRLVDADMNEASTRLKALQAQEQLAIQSLQIANSSAQNLMKLFS